MLVAVLYTADLRAPKLDGPAVRMLSWNVASLRSSLKKVQISSNLCRLLPVLNGNTGISHRGKGLRYVAMRYRSA